jgi:hypothetical protein
LWVASALAVAYTAWVFTGRLLEHKKLERRVMRLAPSTPEFDRIYGGSALKILQFYARDGEIAPSQKTVLCYGVLNATAIRMEPAMDGLRPSVNNCVEVSPAMTTSYTLVAEGAGGATASQSVTVRVSRR